ncbi:SDR family NAD(P)-dependent oxidoreductase [Mycolicibacterium fortuitum]|uniref:SDR family NAD(P)-dependent oxidoreductase n=1 Tax=Mycolicibacterium TaxID=1866885 RepID=UPI003AABD8C9
MQFMRRRGKPLGGQRILITGAARGIGAATAERLAASGARVALAGLEPELLGEVAARCGDAAWWTCDVADRSQVVSVVSEVVEAFGGLDVVMANAGIVAVDPLVGGDPATWDRTVAVNLGGVYNTIHAAGPHISHANGYLLAVASLGAALHAPLSGAYCATKAAIEAVGNVLRQELRPSGARVGVAYFGEVATDMVSRTMDSEAARYLTRDGGIWPYNAVTPLQSAVDHIERGIARRSRRVVAPSYISPALPLRMGLQRFADVALASRVARSVEIARSETPAFTTEQPQ